MKPNQQRFQVSLEILIVVLIAILMVILMKFSDDKLDELITSDKEALFIEHDPDNPLHDELAQQIVEYRPDACKMIEVYSENFEPMVILDFRDEEVVRDSLVDFPELVNLLDTNQSGHTTVVIDGEEEDVFFRWTETSSGEICLFIIYTSRPVVENFWIFHVICYSILGLVCTLLIILAMRSHREKVRQYEQISKNVQDMLLERMSS